MGSERRFTGGDGPDYFLNGRFLETDEGTWRQLPVPQANIVGRQHDPYFDLILIGEDGYEGLVFIAQAAWLDPSCPPECTGFDVHGYIVEGELPLAPEPWSAE